MNSHSSEYYKFLCELHRQVNIGLSDKYRQMRDLLERICRSQMETESLQMTDLSARISFISARAGLTYAEQNRLHTFRLTSNRILNKRGEALENEYLRDVKTLAQIIHRLFNEDIPVALSSLFPFNESDQPYQRSERTQMKRLRVCFQEADDTYLYVVPLDYISNAPIRVRYNVPKQNEEFTPTIDSLWQHAQLNLLDISIDKEGIYTPAFIVLEPDYLLDISTLSECFKEYGSHPANYLLQKLSLITNARPLLLGNIANLFLDEWIHTNGEVDYQSCMRKAFKNYSIELAACDELLDKEKEVAFFADCRMHFDHIQQVVTETFRQPGYELNKEDAVLEPSYICEALGLQGRLDYMQRDMSSFIEMKSGKADEYAIRGKVEPKENNRVQMMLYQAVLEYSMGMDHREGHAYLLYTRYPLLYPARSSWSLVKRAINLRNRIVANEHGVQLHNDKQYTANQLAEVTPAILNEKKLHNKFWEQYLCPSINRFQQQLLSLSALERSYYLNLYNFIAKEQYTSKSGDIAYEGRTGAAALWLSTLAEKREAGEILYDLRLIENRASDEHKAHIILAIPTYEQEFLPNFRTGDVVVLYQRNKEQDNVTNKMVFKGSIETITGTELKVRIRATQRNESILPKESLYAIEHDSMDTAFKSMYQGLVLFAEANKERKELLLSQRLPETDLSFSADIAATTDDFERIALKAEAAKDYFLLVGPPGTGKTSLALKRIVERHYEHPDVQILLLAYTNRAVDEICKSLSGIESSPDYIRVGSELSCEECYRPHLLENQLTSCARRSDVVARISCCRIFVGTVASISNKPELFRLKTFQVAIVDEATQILEPQLLGILCARTGAGANAVGKFILIGDHKQLPAVVLQRDIHAQIKDEDLREIGLYSLKDSLFERLYRNHLNSSLTSHSIDMLCRQGRMNPAVAHFPNVAFYAGKLESVGLPHQTELLFNDKDLETDELSDVINRRLAFLPSVAESDGGSAKSNHYEAKLAAQLAVKLFHRYQKGFDTGKTLGIITPYRNQIALIRKELSSYSIPELMQISVDTVERFQGSERDVIIYSFSVNYAYQLDFLSNTMEEGGVQIDRKLNVALTRARKQLFIIGAPELLKRNPIYRSLLQYINSTC